MAWDGMGELCSADAEDDANWRLWIRGRAFWSSPAMPFIWPIEFSGICCRCSPSSSCPACCSSSACATNSWACSLRWTPRRHRPDLGGFSDLERVWRTSAPLEVVSILILRIPQDTMDLSIWGCWCFFFEVLFGLVVILIGWWWWWWFLRGCVRVETCWSSAYSFTLGLSHYLQQPVK